MLLPIACCCLTASATPTLTVREIEYRGWRGALWVSNGQVEIVVVPAIGRLMRFAQVWDDNPIWENPDLYGQARPLSATTWFNYGGDKVWPAEQSAWPAVMGHGWPPDTALDGRPAEAEILGDGAIRLITSVSEAYGVRCLRTFRLDRRLPRLIIEQRLQKVSGPPRKCTIWNVTQLDHPDALYLPLNPGGAFDGGYRMISAADKTPNNRTVSDGVLTLTRPPEASTKYGVDGGAGWIAWSKGRTVISEHYLYQPGGDYPDQGCAAEIFTSPDKMGRYIEMELLSPQQELSVGQAMDFTIELWLSQLPGLLEPAERLQGVLAQMGTITPAWR